MPDLAANFLNENAAQAARVHWDAVAKPLHSLGRLEDLIVRIAGIQGTEDVCLKPRCALVFCADHGVVAEGVTQSGQEVTALVARSIAEGKANVNLMARTVGADVFAVDVGMATEIDCPGIIRRSVARGTRNMVKAPAMTRSQAEVAVKAGYDLVGDLKAKGYGLIATGEMGIGNTTASAALGCALLGLSPMAAVGRGAGLSDAGLLRKREAEDAPPVRRDRRKADRRKGERSPANDATAHALFEDFARSVLGGMPACVKDTLPCLLGERLWLIPKALCESVEDFRHLTDGLRILRAGLCVGTVVGLDRGRPRFEPDHALSLALGEGECPSFPIDLTGAQAYLRGEALPADSLRGWHTVTFAGLPLGWGKASDGLMKNHYPKGLRQN